MKYLLIILFSFNCLSADDLSAVTFEDEKINTEKSFKTRSSAFYIAAIYAYQAIEVGNSGTTALSEFSPGLELEYISEKKEFSHYASASYLRSIYQQSKVNELKDNTADIIDLTIGSEYSFSKSFDFGLRIKNQSVVVIEKQTSQISNVKTVNANSIGSTISFTLLEKNKRDDLEFNLNLEYDYLLKSEATSHGQMSIGLELVKRSKLQEVKTNLTYSKSEYEYMNEAQSFNQIQLSVAISFGEK